MDICKLTYLLVLPLAPEIDADLLWDLTIIFTGLGLLYILFVFVFRNRLSHKSKGVRLRKKELGPMISNFLFYEDDASLQEKYNHVQLKLEIRELLKDDFNRKVLVEILLDLQKDISGDARNRLFGLYKDLGLHLDAFDKLKSRRWEVISQGIMELTQLQVEESYGFIKKFINHRRGVIRKQAQRATVSLKHEGIVYFLDTCKHRISEWQQLKLLDEIRHLEDFQPPRFKAWLTAKNKDVVLFSLRLIKYYKQNDANASLVELVKHKNDQIKVEAVNCIKEFMVFEALDTLKSVFWNCSASVKLVLLDTIASLGDEKEIPFLKMVESKELNFMVKSKAISAINTISPESVMPTHGIESVPDYDPSQELLGTESSPISGKMEDLLNPPVSELKDTSEDNTLSPIRRSIDLSTDIEQNGADVPDETEVAATGQVQNDPEMMALDWRLDNDSEELKTPADIPSKAAPEDVAQQEKSFPEIQEEIRSSNSEEVVMENKKDIQFDKEDLFETVANGQPQKQDTTDLNSEDAYWDAVLDPEHEDEMIFDLCFMEELEEILSQTDHPEDTWAPHEILPLNFLPIIENEGKEKSVVGTKKADPIFDIEVNEEIVHEDEKFAEELKNILNRIRNTDTNEKMELVPEFIPLVVDTEEEETDAPAEQIDVAPENPVAARELSNESAENAEKGELAIQLPWEEGEELSSLDLEREVLCNLEINYKEVMPQALAGTMGSAEDKPTFEVNIDLEERVSIFNELFRTCDAESKLILLDEILAVGDERDLKFLDTLSKDEDQRVQKKAFKIAVKLEENLNSRTDNDHNHPSRGNDKDTKPVDQNNLENNVVPEADNPDMNTSDDLFDIAFELNMALSQNPEYDTNNLGEPLQTEVSSNSFIDEVLSIPYKIIHKFNG